MNFIKLFALVIFVGLASCKTGGDAKESFGGQSSPPVSQDKKAESVEAAADYKKDGVSFVLRKNWKVVEDEDLGNGMRYINVEDDNNASVSISLEPSDTNNDLKKYADEFMSSMRMNRSVGNITETGESEVTRNAANIEKKGLAKKYNISSSGVSVSHTAEIFLNKARKYDAMIIYSAPDDEKNVGDSGFETILYTLKTE